MAKLLKLRRGTTSQHSSFTGAEGEVTIDTTKDTAVVHDGSQAGGRPLAREDLNNVSSGTIAGRLGTDSIATSKIAAGDLPTDVVATAFKTNRAIGAESIATSAVVNRIIADDAVTFAKVENIAQNTLIGRTASGSGSATDLAASQVRTLINVENGATADQTASEILTLIKTVDGSGSGLDADTLDGVSSASFVRSDASDTLSGATYTIGNSSTDEKIKLSGSSNPYIRWQEGSTNKAYIQWNAGGHLDIVNQEGGTHLKLGTGSTGLQWYDGGYRTVWTSNNDGAGSGLDADLCDGLHVNNSASNNTIVARTSNGYIFANYFNTTPNTISSGVTQICVESGNDGYIRHGTAAAVRSFLNVANGATNVTNNNQLTNGAGYITSATDSTKLPLSGGTLTGSLNGSHIYPRANNTYDLGSTSARWRNIYTNDLHLSNKGHSNEVDGTWGNWTIQEGESDLFLKNNRSGKKYKFNLTEVS